MWLITPFGGLQERVYHDRKFDSIAQLKPVIMLSGMYCYGASLIIASVNGDVVCSILWIRMANTLNTRFTVCRHTVKSLLLQTLCRNIFWRRPTAWLSLQIISMTQTHTCWHVHLTLSHHLSLYVVYMCQKNHYILYMYSIVTSKSESWPRLFWPILYNS